VLHSHYRKIFVSGTAAPRLHPGKLNTGVFRGPPRAVSVATAPAKQGLSFLILAAIDWPFQLSFPKRYVKNS